MPILILLALAGAGVAAFFIVNDDASASDFSISELMGGFNMESIGGPSTVGGYKDVASENQGGSWTTDYDYAFEIARDRVGVPFALLKAHAVRESAMDPHAYRAEPATSSRPPSASYGLMQILWWKNSNRFSKYNYPDDFVGDGSPLYDPTVNATIAAHLIKENLARFGNLRDAINAYNTGVAESKRVAPGNYVNDVLEYYSTLVGGSVT